MKRAALIGTIVALISTFSLTSSTQALRPLSGAPQGATGTGDSLPSFKAINEPVIVTLTHDGSSNFIVNPIGKDGEEGMYWVNAIGPFQGTTFQEMNDIFSPFGKKNPLVAATVMADGNWSIQVRKLSAAPVKPLRAGKGAGNDVIRFRSLPRGLTRIVLTHDGKSNFVVYPIDGKGKVGSYLTNEIGEYRGTLRLPAGTKYLWVKADGNWSYRTR